MMRILTFFETLCEYKKIKILIDNLPNVSLCYIGKNIELSNEFKTISNLEIDDIITEHKINDIFSNIDFVLVQDNTLSALRIAMYAFNNGIQVIHMGAGSREDNIANGEKISKISSIHLCYTEYDKYNLLKENISGEIYLINNKQSYNICSYDNNIHSDNFLFYIKMIGKKINLLSNVPKENNKSSEGILFGRFTKTLEYKNIKYHINDLDFNNYDFNIFFSCWYKGCNILNRIEKILLSNEKILSRCVFYPYVFDLFSKLSCDLFLQSFSNSIFIGEQTIQTNEYKKYNINNKNLICAPLGINIDHDEIDYTKNNIVMIYIKMHSNFYFDIKNINYLIDVIPKSYIIKIFYYSTIPEKIMQYDYAEYINTIKKTRFVIYYSPSETLGYSNIDFRAYNIPFFCLKFSSIYYYDNDSCIGHNIDHLKILDEKIITPSGYICDNSYMTENKIKNAFIDFMNNVDNKYFTPQKLIRKYLDVNKQIMKFFQ